VIFVHLVVDVFIALNGYNGEFVSPKPIFPMLGKKVSNDWKLCFDNASASP